ncbi:MAG: LptF/LptG family permease [Nitrospirae bacterium]|nr:LptF/LptG family permease [Nitrospirota bacterium]
MTERSAGMERLARRIQVLLRPTASRYIISEYGKYMLLTLAGLMVLYGIVELFEIGRLLYRYRADLKYLPSLFVLKMPLIAYQMIPAAALMGTLIATGLLLKNNELIVLRICGFTYARLFSMILIPCTGMAALDFWMGDRVVPRAVEARNRIVIQEIRKVERAAVQTESGTWIPGISSIFRADRLSQEEQVLDGARVYKLDEQYRLRSYFEAEKARYGASGWTLEKGRAFDFEPGQEVQPRAFESEEIRLPEAFADFEIFRQDPDAMSFGNLWTLTRKLAAEGYDATEYQVALHSRLSFPALAAPLSLLGFALAHMGGRKKTMGGNLFLAVLASFFAWVLFGLTIILGRHGLLPAEVSAWLVHLPLVFAGLVLLTREL